ncbi:HipA domain-containing protein [Alcanivorax sp. S71-1-4]|uniref:type II toxin-antitoxin system HipA family toxin n=1 Tax=Alcanivorax sp. S71-1-4 TaxID=1177159 RepID=UPI0013599D79|nr:type II toxin-antitoxin system HipA family toxin [Alcanivorax sp. S71-1-4]KAF0809810.1 HipA domain-containing protein [Alcanivorax sp. S71-1-4]
MKKGATQAGTLVASVVLWGAHIGAVRWDPGRQLGFFEYAPAFRRSGIQVAPLTMPLDNRIHAFPQLARDTFRGLPGLLADSLPDKFGNAVIDAWLAEQGRSREDFSPVERLCYIGRRGMGALEFEPAAGRGQGSTLPLDIGALAALSDAILAQRDGFSTWLSDDEQRNEKALRDIIQVGVSAGGARAKALVAWNEATQEIRSGQLQAPPGFRHWLLKFDGVTHNRDKEQFDPAGFGLIEYAYYLMATAAGIDMPECRLLRENGRSHFMCRRFDRTDDGQKLHMQSLCAIAHYDFNMAGAWSYEQAMQVMQRLGLNKLALEEQFRRMVFNVLARNQDDHTKNIAFLMNRRGEWSLSPAFDVTFAYNPDGVWTQQHQMSIQGKRDHFSRDDLLAVARRFAIMDKRALDIIDGVASAVRQWPAFAAEAGVDEATTRAIATAHAQRRW